MSSRLSDYRVLALSALLAATVVYRAVDLGQVFFGSSAPRMPGFSYRIQGKNLVVDVVREKNLTGSPTPAALAGLKPHDRILAVYNKRGHGREIKGLFDYGAALRGIRRDEPWTIVVARAEPHAAHAPEQMLRLKVPPTPDSAQRDIRVRLLTWLFYVLLPLIALATGFFIGFARPDNSNAFLASLLFVCLSSVFDSNILTFPAGFQEFGLVYQTALNTFLGYLFLRFFLIFPAPSWLERKAPWIKHVAFGLSAFLFAVTLFYGLLGARSFALQDRFSAGLPLTGSFSSLTVLAIFLLGLTSLILNTATAEGRDERRRLGILLLGTLAGLLPLVAFVVYLQVGGAAVPNWWLLGLVGSTVGIFPLSFVYVVVRHRVLGIRLIVRRGLRYALVSRGFLVVEGAVIFLVFFFAARPWIFRLVPDADQELLVLITASTTLISVVGLRSVNRKIMPAIDRRFFREAYSAQQVLTDLTRNVRRLVTNPAVLLRTVTDTISDSFLPEHVALFLGGDEALSLVSAEGSPLQALVNFNPRNRGDVHLCWIRRRSEADGGKGTGESPLSPVIVPADSFLMRKVEEAATEDEAEALDVFLGDPKTWTAPLLRAGGDPKLARDRRLLERMGVRLIVPLGTREDVLGFLTLGERLSEEPYSREDKKLLLAVAEQTAIALDYAHLIGQMAEQQRLKRDIEIAKQVQAQLFPQTLPQMATLDCAAICRPAQEVGGDYYDFLQLRGNELCLALGDISGKGLSASLLMASLQALLRSQAPLRAYAPGALISDINRLMCSSSDGSKYATFFCGIYHESECRLTYVNAGHNPPMLFRSDGRSGGDRNGSRLERLLAGGTVVGLFPDAVYEQESITLGPGDVLVIFTDGVTEAFSAEREEFGEERLIDAVNRSLDLPALGIRDRVLAAVAEFVGPAPQHDDLTLVVLKVKD